MNSESLAGLAIVVGALLFLLAAFNPSATVFAQPTVERKVAVLHRHPTLWVISQPLFGAGATLGALGVALVALFLGPSEGAPLAYFAAGLLLIGALCWDLSVYRRAVAPDAFARGSLPGWPFRAYTLLTNLGLIVFGAALWVAGFPLWLAALVAGGGAVFLVAYLVFGDLPPFVYYLVLLVVGLVIVL